MSNKYYTLLLYTKSHTYSNHQSSSCVASTAALWVTVSALVVQPVLLYSILYILLLLLLKARGIHCDALQVLPYVCDAKSVNDHNTTLAAVTLRAQL
jgi:hypothetical protein